MAKRSTPTIWYDVRNALTTEIVVRLENREAAVDELTRLEQAAGRDELKHRGLPVTYQLFEVVDGLATEVDVDG